MSKPDWTALADRYGAQGAVYDDGYLVDGDGIAMPCRGCDEPAQDGGAYCRACRDANAIRQAHLDAGAAQEGQASIALALGAWLALMVAFAVLAMCVYGAAWVDGAWLAPFAGLAR